MGAARVGKKEKEKESDSLLVGKKQQEEEGSIYHFWFGNLFFLPSYVITFIFLVTIPYLQCKRKLQKKKQKTLDGREFKGYI